MRMGDILFGFLGDREMSSVKSTVCNALFILVAVIVALSPIAAVAQTSAAAKPKPEYPPLTTVIKD